MYIKIRKPFLDKETMKRYDMGKVLEVEDKRGKSLIAKGYAIETTKPESSMSDTDYKDLSAKLSQKVDILEGENKTLTEELQKVKTENGTLTTKLETAEKEKADLQKQLDDVNKELEKLKTKA